MVDHAVDALDRIRSAAMRGERMNALAHHVYSVAMLRRSFDRINACAAPGADGVTVEGYRFGLDGRLRSLADRLRDGSYRPQPLLRAYIPKPLAPNELRAIDLPTVDDKVAQGALAMVLLAVYGPMMSREDLCFGPARSDGTRRPVGIAGARVVIETDIADCFGSVDTRRLLAILRRRISDRPFLAIVRSIVGDGVGIPQGLPCSPALNAVYLSHVVDRWLRHWTRTEARGYVRFGRYVDDLVIACEKPVDAARVRIGLSVRLAKFGMRLKNSKTRETAPRDGAMFLGTVRASGSSYESRRVPLLRRRVSVARSSESLRSLWSHYRPFLSRRALGALRVAMKGAA